MASTKKDAALVAACVRNSVVFDQTCSEIFNELVDEVALGIAFDIHRSVRTGIYQLVENFDAADDPNDRLSDAKGLVDIFGQVISTTTGVPTLKKQPECTCPNCQRNLAASRFAPHLEKCMGMGRNSSRLASRRIANNNKEHNTQQSGTADEDDIEDEDWLEPSRAFSSNRKKRDKNSPRRNRGKNANSRWKVTDEDVDIDSFTEGDTVALRESLAQLSSSPAESTVSTSSNPCRGGNRKDKSRRGTSSSGKRTRPGSKSGSRGSSPPAMYD